jgi:hypothetical protein
VGLPSSVVLSALEFDVVWESLRLPARHVVLDVPSPGVTRNERAGLVAAAWAGLAERGLAERSVDGWIWTDREIRGLAAQVGREAMLAVIDHGEVWLIPARDSSLVEAAVSMAGECPPGRGRSTSVPLDALRSADRAAGGDPQSLVVELTELDVPLGKAQIMARMFAGLVGRGQFGAQRMDARRATHRARRVVAFHDTGTGRYLYLTRPSPDGQLWATVTPADNRALAAAVWELLDEV